MKKIFSIIVVCVSLIIPEASFAVTSNDLQSYVFDTTLADIGNPDPTCSGNTAATPPGLSIEQKIAQTLLVGVDSSQQDLVKSMVAKYHLGGVFVLGHASKTDFTKSYFDSLNASAGVPLIIASDEEGGQVQRFEQIPSIGSFPSARETAAMSDADVIALGTKIGQGLKAAGVTTNLAPVLDLLTSNSQNADNLGDPSRSRSYSSDPNIITTKAGDFAKGLAAGGIGSVLKHFPGIGQLTGNTDTSALTLPKLAALKNDLLPYQALANQNNSAVMLSNAYVPDWGSASPVGVNPLAVKFLRAAPYNFTGLIMTDDLSAIGQQSYGAGKIDLPTAVSKALLAGVDMPLFKVKDDAQMQTIIATVKATVPISVIDAANTAVATYKSGHVSSASPASPGAGASSCCNTSSAKLSGADNAAIVFNYFNGKVTPDGKKVTPEQAAGITGNMIYESGIEPERLEAQFNFLVPATEIAKNLIGKHTGWGIVQWTPYTKMVDRVLAAKLDPNLISVQLDFLWQQLTNTGLGGQIGEVGAMRLLQVATTPEAASYAFSVGYERFFTEGSISTEQQDSIDKRKLGARAIFENATKGTPIPPNIKAGISTSAASGAATPTTTTPVASSCTSGASGGTIPPGVPGKPGVYKDPLRDIKPLEPGRIDGGADYNGPDGAIYAIGNGQVTYVATSGSGWPGLGTDSSGAYIAYSLTDGKAAGKFVYTAEDCTPLVKVGDPVTPDTKICNFHNVGTHMELGWGNGQGSYVSWTDYHASTDGGYDASNAGKNFSSFMTSIGSSAGIVKGPSSTTPVGPGFPTTW